MFDALKEGFTGAETKAKSGKENKDQVPVFTRKEMQPLPSALKFWAGIMLMGRINQRQQSILIQNIQTYGLNSLLYLHG
jgi:hypothetical protein